MAKTVKIGLVQMSCGPIPEENFTKAVNRVSDAADRGAQIVCLQELFRSTYFCQAEEVNRFDLAETIPGPSTEELGNLAAKKGVVIIASLFEQRTPGIYHNTAVVIDQRGKIVGKYRKMHIPDDPFYYEKFYFTPGDLGFLSHQTDFGNLGILVCWDQWFPEAARLTALAGAQILFYPTAIGWLPGEIEETNRAQHSAWEISQRAHAVANGVFVAAVNRVGKEENLQFWGQSFISDPFGRLIAKASDRDEEILIAECDLSKVEKTRREWCFLRDRRIDAYEDLTRRFRDRD
ncbi:MAG: carbon-nitrogen hydrolase [Acidobacteriota bacterium]|nr:MAG: carbon-nitrogen hydrolase [Acidobacteriota bacterium]